MDEIEILTEEIRKDENFQKTRFNTSFLNNVAEVFEKYGFGTTRTFLFDKQGRGDLQYQARALLSILDRFEKVEKIRQNRSIGRYIMKTLIELQDRRRG